MSDSRRSRATRRLRALVSRQRLAHALVVAALLAPSATFVAHLFHHRREPLVEALAGGRPAVLALAAAGGALGLAWRRRLFDAVDRRFFRERYDARRAFDQLGDWVRGAGDVFELGRRVDRGLRRALGVERATLLVDEPTAGRLVDPAGEVRPLDLGSKLVTLVHGNREPIETDLESDRSLLRALPEGDRHWLADARSRLLAPAYASDGALVGLLSVGPRPAERPLGGDERRLLGGLCAAAGQTIELLLLRLEGDRRAARRGSRSGERESWVDVDPGLLKVAEHAGECPGCGGLQPPESERCERCRLRLDRAPIPYVLRRKYRFERRIGAGGMAVVYRATDLELGRPLAIKTLPRVSPEAAARLHREARAAAAVSHPGLAAIYGFETWRGTPMILMELLDGGTLADRLADGPLGALDAVLAGQSVALALDRIHAAGILHRDIKPSNVGFTPDGAAKLLDFGIARLEADLRAERATRPSDASWSVSWNDAPSAGHVAGTITYLSPEALDGARPGPGFDLWSLSVVLYEALTGENLFYGPSPHEVLTAIREARVPDLRERMPDCPAGLAELFRAALARDPARRPRSGRELHQRLEEVRRELAG